MAGAAWSVDVEATVGLLARVDNDASELSADSARFATAQGDVVGALAGSDRVLAAFDGFITSHESVPGRILGRVQRSAAAAIACVEAVVVADDEMAGNAADSREQLPTTRFRGGLQ